MSSGKSPFEFIATYDLGDAWSSNSANCASYRMEAIYYKNGRRYICYFDSNGNIKVALQRSESSELQFATINNTKMPFDAHESVSMGLDELGHIHLLYGGHSTNFIALRSLTTNIHDGFASSQIKLPNATYPMFLHMPQGNLSLLYREGVHYSGAIRAAQFDLTSGSWRLRRRSLISGRSGRWSAGPYLNTPSVAPNGQIHLFYVWRLPGAATSGGQVINTGIDYLRSDANFNTLTTSRGLTLSQPVTPTNSERIIAVPFGSNLVNQSSATLMRHGRPSMMTYWDQGDGIPQFRLCWPDKTGWSTKVVSDFTTRFTLDGRGTLPLPHSRPAYLFDRRDNLIIIFRSTEYSGRLVARILEAPEYSLSSSITQILVDDDLGYYEPILDRSSWTANGELAIYSQYCHQQAESDGVRDFKASPAKLFVWKLNVVGL